MRLGKPAAVLVLIATAVPLAYLVFFLATMLTALLAGPESSPLGERFVVVLFVLHFSCMLWLVGLIVFYLAFLFKTEAVPADKKALWAVVLFLGNMLAMPVFWYLYMWRPLRHSPGLQSLQAAPGGAAGRPRE
jgi:hypothetical protein